MKLLRVLLLAPSMGCVPQVSAVLQQNTGSTLPSQNTQTQEEDNQWDAYQGYNQGDDKSESIDWSQFNTPPATTDTTSASTNDAGNTDPWAQFNTSPATTDTTSASTNDAGNTDPWAQYNTPPTTTDTTQGSDLSEGASENDQSDVWALPADPDQSSEQQPSEKNNLKNQVESVVVSQPIFSVTQKYVKSAVNKLTGSDKKSSASKDIKSVPEKNSPLPDSGSGGESAGQEMENLGRSVLDPGEETGKILGSGVGGGVAGEVVGTTAEVGIDAITDAGMVVGDVLTGGTDTALEIGAEEVLERETAVAATALVKVGQLAFKGAKEIFTFLVSSDLTNELTPYAVAAVNALGDQLKDSDEEIVNSAKQTGKDYQQMGEDLKKGDLKGAAEAFGDTFTQAGNAAKGAVTATVNMGKDIGEDLKTAGQGVGTYLQNKGEALGTAIENSKVGKQMITAVTNSNKQIGGDIDAIKDNNRQVDQEWKEGHYGQATKQAVTGTLTQFGKGVVTGAQTTATMAKDLYNDTKPVIAKAGAYIAKENVEAGKEFVSSAVKTGDQTKAVVDKSIDYVKKGVDDVKAAPEKATEEAKAKAEEAEKEAKAKAEEAAAETKKLADEAKAKAEQEAAEAKKLADEAKAKAEQEAAEAKKLADEAKAKVEQEAAEMTKLADAAKAKVENAFSKIFGGVSPSASNVFSNLLSSLENKVGSGVQNTWNTVSSGAQNVGNDISSGVQSVGNDIASIF